MRHPEYIEVARAQALEEFQKNPVVKLNYGLTIRLDTRNLSLDAETHSEQIITIEHENCHINNLFDELENPVVKEHLFSTTSSEKTPISHFNAAHFDLGLFIHVPKNTEASVSLARTITSKALREHILIVVEPGSSLTVIDQQQSQNCKLKTGAVEIIAKDNAKVKYATIQNLEQTTFDFTTYQANAHKDANVDWFVGSLGASLSQATVDTHLLGENSEVRSYGVFHGNNTQQFDISSACMHKGNRSRSDMYTRGVLDDKAKGVFRGLIDIDAQAFGCDGYQKEETILVSPQAVADAIPNLEIRNNDVKCSHGATIGRIDDEQLFYLKSRGVDEKKAIQMIVEGFFEPVSTKLGWPELFERILPIVKEKIHGK